MHAHSVHDGAIAQWTGAERDPTLSIAVVRGLAEAAGAAGIDKSRLLGAVGFQPSLLEVEDARVSRSSVLLMCELALELADDPAFALHWGEHASESSFAPLSHLIAHSANLGAALQTLFDYHRLVADEAPYALVAEGDCMTLRLSTLLHPSARLRTFVPEMEAVGIFRMMRMFGVSPQLVSFAYPAPAYRDEYARIFGGRERFDAPHSGITFARSAMSSVSPHKDDEVRKALQDIASRRVLRLINRMPCSLLLRGQLVKQRKCIRPDMTQAAEALGVSVRSLRRRLKAEGTSFYDVATEAATLIAKELLAQMHKSIQEVAFEMGFADASGFHRAFKRWTGLTPSAYRDSW